MTVNEGLRAVAGSFILPSVALGILVNAWFFAFTAFVGLNLLQSAFPTSAGDCAFSSGRRCASVPGADAGDGDPGRGGASA